MASRRSVWLIAVAIGALVGALGVFGASAAPPSGTDAPREPQARDHAGADATRGASA